jgi:hypothetical protein
MIIFTIILDPEPDSDPLFLFSDPDQLKPIISDPAGSGSRSRSTTLVRGL